MSVETLDTSGYSSPDDLKGYDYPAPGLYHCAVNSADVSREKYKGPRLDCQVLAGTVDGQAGKTWGETLIDPSPDHKDGGEFANKKQTSFALGTGLILPSQLGQPLGIDWEMTPGRQFVCKLKHYKRNGKGENADTVYEGAEIDGLNIWPVNHADVANVPKDNAALALLGQAAVAPVAPQPTAPMQPGVAPPATAPPAQPTQQNWSNF